jgi:23S rRNA (guanosine2251-2'-O)-methyltransferase
MQKTGTLPVLVILDNVRSMHNVGSVFRTGDAFLVEGICLCGYTPRPPHRDIQKTALGATDTVPWTYKESIKEAIEECKTAGRKVWAVEQVQGSLPLQDFAPTESIALVFGNEVEGVSKETLALCEGAVEIPQWGVKHSLNVSVAAGVVLWEIRKLHIP